MEFGPKYLNIYSEEKKKASLIHLYLICNVHRLPALGTQVEGWKALGNRKLSILPALCDQI